MSRNMKIVLGVVGGLLGCCCITVLGLSLAGPLIVDRVAELAGGAVSDDPAQAAEIGRRIVDYELPPGFQEEMGTEFFGVRMVFISATEGPVIMLMQLPDAVGAEPAELEAQVQEAFARQAGEQNVTWAPAGTREVTINGRATTMSIQEGVDEGNRRMRQATAVFESDGGAAILFMTGPIDTWNGAAVDAFLNSLR